MKGLHPTRQIEKPEKYKEIQSSHQQRKSAIVRINPHISVITLKVDGINSPVKYTD